MTEETQASYDRRAGSVKPWWKDLLNHRLSREDLPVAELAVRVKRNPALVRFVLHSTKFKEMMAGATKMVRPLEDAKEAITALTTGMKFSHSRGQMEDKFRVVIMNALNDTSMKPVYGKDGIIGEEPTISELDKAKLAMDGFKVLNQKASQLIGKQVNIDKSQHLSLTTVDMLDDSLKELFKASMMHLPMRRIEHEDGSDEVVLDLPEEGVNTPVERDLDDEEEGDE